jgi:protein TonB
VTVEDIMKAPTVIPKTVKVIRDEPEPVNTGAVGVVGGVPGGVPGGQVGGVLGGVIGGVLSPAAPPPPPPPKAATPKRIRVGGQVESAKLIFQPKPEYPQLAKMARIQGVVRLEAIISKDGTIQDLKVVSGHPLLVKAALEAVQRWRYQPTLLNGEPVEVVTEIDVNFTLAE